MGSLSKESVDEAIKVQAAQEQRMYSKPEQRPSALESLKGMLNPKAGPGRAAKREAYVKYVDEQNAAGKTPLSYDEWVAGQ